MTKLNKLMMATAFIFSISSFYLVAEDTTTGTVEAEVLSQDGSTVSGASVTIKSTDKGITRSTTADENGNLRFVLLPPGSYEILVQAAGYNALSDTINVGVGDLSFDFVLESVGEIDEVVVVAGAVQGLDFNNTTTGISVDVDEIMETTPLSRNLTDIILLAPGTSQGDSAFGNLASISGSSVAENVYLINGLDTTNFRNFTGSSTVPFEFYDTVEVKTGGYAAEFGKAIGGVVNAVTKSGTNDFQFGGNVYYFPDSLYDKRRDTYISANKFDERDYLNYNVYASGPIVKDKAFFYVLASPTDNESVNAGFSGNHYTDSTDETFYGAKLDWFVNDQIHLEYTYFSDESTGLEQRRDIDTDTGEVDPEVLATTLYERGGDNEIFKASFIVNENLSMSAMVATNDYNRTDAGTGDSYNYIWWPYPQNSEGLASQLVPTVGADSREITKFDLDYYVGDHHFRFGVEEAELESLSTTQYSGTNARAVATELGYRNVNFTCGGVYYRGYDGDGDGVIVAGDRLRLRTYCSGGTFMTLQDVVYIQDSWDVSDQLNLNIGFRRSSYDNQNAAGETFIKVEDQDALRLGATYDIGGDGTSKLFASFGEYYLPIAANTNIRLAGSEYFSQQFGTWDGTVNNADEFIPGITPGSLGDVSYYGDGSVPDSRGTADATIEPMYAEELIIGYSTILEAGIFSGWDLNVVYTERELASTIEDVQIDHVFPPGEVHQYVLTNPGTDMTVYVDDLGEFRDFTAEELQYPEVVREYDGITLELSRPWDGDWYANIAYTNSDTIGNYEGTVKSDNGQDDAGITQDFDFPEFVEGSYGKLPNHRKHNFKFTGAKTFGNGLIGGISVSAISPRYYGCIGNHPISTVVYTDSSWYCNGELTPRGSQAQSSWVIDVDAMLSYKVPVSVGDLTLKVDVFNVFNMDAVVDLREYGETGGIVGNADPNYLKPTLYQTPRRVRLSATYRF